MLTGESVPVIKNSLPKNSNMFEINNDSKYILYSGTKIIQTRKLGFKEKVLGLVIRTGFVTSKGNLVRAILYPVPYKYKFNRDALITVFVMFIIAIIAFFGTLSF
jgi:cation-transporting ATPase 13A3/4/5